MGHRSVATILGLTTVICFSTFLGAQQVPSQPDETLPGFKSNDVLFAGPVDHVSAYSGDSGIVIPLGREFVLGPGTTWQLKAYNTLKVWYTDGNYSCTDVNGALLQNVSQAFILGLPALGAGWNLSLGYVGTWEGSGQLTQGPLVYISPDGGIHKTDANGVTFDEPHLRVKCQTQTSCTVEFPDGSKGTFTHTIPDPAPTAGASPDFTFGDVSGALGLTSWTDAFSNTLLTATYGTNGAPAWGISTVVLHPSTTAAMITFNWKTPAGTPSTVTVNGTDWSGAAITATWPVLYSIQFPTISAGNQSELATFSYASTPYERNQGIDTTASSNCSPPNPEQVLAPTLTKITLNRVPSGGSAVSVGSYSMGYDYATGRGIVNSVTMPTGGKIAFTFGGGGPYNPCSTWPVTGLEASDLPTGCSGGTQTLAAPSPSCRICRVTGSSAYVATRTLTVGSTVSKTTYKRNNYVPSLYPTQNLGTGHLTRVVEVTDPVDPSTTRLTRFMFHNPDENSDPTIAGLELERTIESGTTFTTPPLRTIVSCGETVDTSGANPFCGYLDDDGTVHDFSNQGQVRHAGSITWYGDKPSLVSGGSCSSASTGCDSVLANTWVPGAYKYTTTVHSTSHLTNNITRTVVTDWKPCNTSTQWLLDLFDYKKSTDTSGSAPLSVQTNYSFESCKPFVTKTTIADATGTLETDFTDDGHGNPSTISRWGNPSTSGLTTTKFTDTLTFQGYLPLSRSRGGLTWKAFNATRDAATGLIKSSLDPNNLTTTYTYDGLGRLTNIAPPGSELATAISYDSTTQTTVTRGSGSTGTYERYLYDGAGRLAREIRQMPTGYAFRTHAFDIGGHESFTSEWRSCTTLTSDCVTGTAAGTTLTSFDIFDRPQRVTRADGSYTTIDRSDGVIDFSDTYETTTVYNAAGTIAAGPTETAKDILGRVRSVQEASAIDVVNGVPTQEAPTTTYSYNVLDKLGSVLQGSQTRGLAYTTYGFLKSETNPEKGTTTYSSYDALGDLLSKTDGGIGYTNTYDSAGLLLAAKSGSTTFAMNCYDGSANVPTCPDGTTANAPGGTYPKGRLTRRVGYNPSISASAIVTDSFTYSDATGRLSAKAIALAGSPIGSTLTANESWTYNSLGSIATFMRPGIGATGTASSQTYAHGLPTTMTTAGGTQTLTSNVTYAAAGQLSGWKAGPASGAGVVTTITPETSGIPRPHQITATSGATTVFNTGLYGYDGDGNIKTMGSDTFGYDARSRLTSSTVRSIPLAYSYDRYGNLTSGLPTGVEVSSSTNRFTAASGISYDSLGDLTVFSGATYGYDALGRQTSFASGSVIEKYVYDGGNERIARVSSAGATWFATFRDDANQLATEYTITPTAYTKTKDYFHLGNLLVATYASGSYAFYSSDHLGTPRYASNVSGGFVEAHNYQPYGEEIGGTFGGEPLKFAKMERDQLSGNDCDHARFHLTGKERFATLDREPGSFLWPSSWNRYSYAKANPLKWVDPDGHASADSGGVFQTIRRWFRQALSPREGTPSNTRDERVATMREAGLTDSEISRSVDVGFRSNSELADSGGIVGGVAAEAGFAYIGAKAGDIIVGESQPRVDEAARLLGLDTFVPKTTELEAIKAEDAAWVRAVFDAGSRIFDIGLDRARALRGPFYAVENGVRKTLPVARRFVRYIIVNGEVTKLMEWIRR